MRSRLCVCGVTGAYLVYVWEEAGQAGSWITWKCKKNVHLLFMSNAIVGLVVQLPRSDTYHEVVKVGCSRQPFGPDGAECQVDTVFLKEWKHETPAP